EPPRRAVEQPRTEPPLQPADRLRDRRLGQRKFARSRRERPQFHDFGKDRECLEIRKRGHLKTLTSSLLETMSFNSFYFYITCRAISKSQHIPKEHPMIELRPFAKLGSADHGWLKAKHHFSFGTHYDPGNMGHGSLRVWNDEEIAPNTGFPAHPHANMEIITYVREGAITHQDSLGNKGRTEAGDVQVMSAGAGIRHSEYNLEPTRTKIFQIWIEPTTQGGSPTWGAKPFPKSNRSGGFVT